MSLEASYFYLAGDSQPFLVAASRRDARAVLDRVMDNGGYWVTFPTIAGDDDTPKVTRATIRASQIVAITEPTFTDDAAAELGMAIADAFRDHPDWFTAARVTR